MRRKNILMTQNEATVLFWNCLWKLAKESPPGMGPGAQRLHCLESGVTGGQRLGVRSSDDPADNSDTQFSEKDTESTQLLLRIWEASRRTEVRPKARSPGRNRSPGFSRTRRSSQAEVLTQTHLLLISSSSKSNHQLKIWVHPTGSAGFSYTCNFL